MSIPNVSLFVPRTREDDPAIECRSTSFASTAGLDAQIARCTFHGVAQSYLFVTDEAWQMDPNRGAFRVVGAHVVGSPLGQAISASTVASERAGAVFQASPVIWHRLHLQHHSPASRFPQAAQTAAQ